MPGHPRQQCLRGRVAGLAREREAQVVLDVVVPRVDAGVLRQLRELLHEGGVELVHAAAVVHVARARVEQRVAGEQRRLVGVRAQADVAHRVAGRVQAFQFDVPADLDHVPGLHAAVHAFDLARGLVVRDHLGAGGRHHGRVAAGVVVVLVRVEDLRDLPALDPGRVQGFFMVQRIDRQRFAGLGAGDQVVEVAVRITGPDAFDEHGGSWGIDGGDRGGRAIVGTRARLRGRSAALLCQRLAVLRAPCRG